MCTKYPNRKFSMRVPSLPGNPLICPKCPTISFEGEVARDQHYLQCHILKIAATNIPNQAPSVSDRDRGNHNGPLGRKQHVFIARRFYEEPESYNFEDHGKSDEELKMVERVTTGGTVVGVEFHNDAILTGEATGLEVRDKGEEKVQDVIISRVLTNAMDDCNIGKRPEGKRYFDGFTWNFGKHKQWLERKVKQGD